MNEISKINNTCSNLKFGRKNDIIVQKSIKEYINTHSELHALLDAGTHSVFVVREIKYCNGPALAGVVGCSKAGSSVVVENVDKSIASVLWLHEFGHTQGLSKTTDNVEHTTRANSVMNSRIGSNTKVLNSSECRVLVKQSVKFPDEELLPVSNNDGASPAVVIRTSEESSDVVRLLSELWVHGPPIDRIKVLNSDQVDEVRRVLFDRRLSALWKNAVTTIGFAGVPADVEFLGAFLGLSVGTNDVNAERAILQVPFAVGVLNVRFDGSGISFLKKNASPNRVAPLGATAEGDIALRNQFAIESIRSLALLGTAEAAAAIERAQNENRAGFFNLGVGDEFFDQLGQIRQGVARYGLEGYVKQQEVQ